MRDRTARFWEATTDVVPVERRVVWQFGRRRGELVVSFATDQTVTPLAAMSAQTADAATLDAKALNDGTTVAPHFVFALIGQAENGAAIVTGPGQRQVPVVDLPGAAADAGEPDIQAMMDRAKAALPPAQVAPGDHAVGFLVRRDAIYFYPVVAVTEPAEIESYQEGAGSTADLIHSLPFQS